MGRASPRKHRCRTDNIHRRQRPSLSPQRTPILSCLPLKHAPPENLLFSLSPNAVSLMPTQLLCPMRSGAQGVRSAGSSALSVAPPGPASPYPEEAEFLKSTRHRVIPSKDGGPARELFSGDVRPFALLSQPPGGCRGGQAARGAGIAPTPRCPRAHPSAPTDLQVGILLPLLTVSFSLHESVKDARVPLALHSSQPDLKASI